MGVDVGEVAKATIKWLQGKHLEPDDEVSLYGVFEGKLTDLGSLTEFVNRLVGARGVSVEADANVTVDLVATKDGGVESAQRDALLATLPEAACPPSTSCCAPCSRGARDWATPQRGGRRP